MKKEKSEQWHDPGTGTGQDGKVILVKHRSTYVRVHTFRITHRDGSRTAATSKMKLFVIIVNGFQPLTIITKCSILDVPAVLDPPLTHAINSDQNEVHRTNHNHKKNSGNNESKSSQLKSGAIEIDSSDEKPS